MRSSPVRVEPRAAVTVNANGPHAPRWQVIKGSDVRARHRCKWSLLHPWGSRCQSRAQSGRRRCSPGRNARTSRRDTFLSTLAHWQATTRQGSHLPNLSTWQCQAQKRGSGNDAGPRDPRAVVGARAIHTGWRSWPSYDIPEAPVRSVRCWTQGRWNWAQVQLDCLEGVRPLEKGCVWVGLTFELKPCGLLPHRPLRSKLSFSTCEPANDVAIHDADPDKGYSETSFARNLAQCRL